MLQTIGAEGSDVALLIVLAAIFGVILAILWTVLPFAVFGIKSKLNTVISEQRHTTEAINALRQGFRFVADKASANQSGHQKASRLTYDFASLSTTKSNRNPYVHAAADRRSR